MTFLQSPKVKMTLIIVGGVVLLGLAVVSMLSGGAVNFVRILEIIGATAGGGAIVRAFSGGSSSNGGATALVVFALLGAQGCCGTAEQRGVVSALDVAIDASEAAVGDEGGNGWTVAVDAARELVDIGDEVCALISSSAGWQEWVRAALTRASALVSHFAAARIAGDAAVPGQPPITPPIELLDAVEALQAEVEP